MQTLGPIVRLWQKAPLTWRKSLAYAPRLRALANRFYADQPEVFPLAKPLEGHRMRLHWQSGKAYVFGTFETEVTKAMQRVVRPGQSALDVGANIGYFTLLLARLVGASGRVVAFEPFAEAFEVLKENVALNGYSNVKLENKAAADRSGPLNFSQNHTEPLSSMGSLTSGAGIPVFGVSLDDYLGFDGCRADFVKVDVEGAETDVLKGMSRTLEKDRPILLIELHSLSLWGGLHPALLQLRQAKYGVTFLDGPGSQVHILAEPRAVGCG